LPRNEVKRKYSSAKPIRWAKIVTSRSSGQAIRSDLLQIAVLISGGSLEGAAAEVNGSVAVHACLRGGGD
jgi:hypothetical protein